MNERTLERYRLLEEVGQGGMAVVYKGFDTTLNREVAVKVLHPHLAGMAESRARLQREAHAVAKLRHENILEIFDYSGPDSPESFIVTEFIHGRTLKSFLAEHPLPFPELAEMICSEVAGALGHAHALGVIHRDIKPENVMIRDDGVLKLMDFGIAQIVDKERMTVTGQLLGSPAYMAPEHVEGRPIDFRTDVFAVGILLYQLATGQLPFRGKNPHEVLKKIAECKFTPPELVNPKIGTRLSKIIQKALERDPERRYADVVPLREQLVADLADAGVDEPRKALQGFFADPTGWAEAFKPRLLRALADRGKALAQKGRKAAALELWSRALAIEPGSRELRALVDGLARRRRIGRVAVVLAGMGALSAATFVGLRAMRVRPAAPPVARVAPPRTTAPEPASAGVVPAAAPKNAPATEPPEPAPAPRKAPGPEPSLHAPKAPRLALTKAAPPAEAPARKVRLVLTPPGDIQVALDDGPARPYDPSQDWALDDQPHVLHLTSPYFVSQNVDVPATFRGVLPVTMAWKMARLEVKAVPESADVVIDDRPPVRAGQAVDLEIKRDDGMREVTVKISAAGYESQTLRVTVMAGKTSQKTVELVRRVE